MDAPLLNFNRHREDIEREVVDRAVDWFAKAAGRDPLRSYQLVLNDAALNEIHRLQRNRPRSSSPLESWERLARQLGRMTEPELEREVRKQTARYVNDVAGHFDRRVYRFATSALPTGLGALFKTTDLIQGLTTLRELESRIRVEGEIERVRELAQYGTLVIVPTHSSNLDSIVMGWSIHNAGLPPCTYGAGKNLFSNPLVGFFMRNLGAYRVDRRLRHMLYKDVLKFYSQVLIERGYHSLFFPGGTRSRSGEIERRLKLGLVGSAISAFAERIQRDDRRPIYIVPVTINYPLVLEAETLVEDHLKEAGQARYIIDDDEFAHVSKVSHFVARIMGLDTTMVIRYGNPLDVFGNPVGPDGRSRGPNGTTLDAHRYFLRDGEMTVDAQRDTEYTRQTGAAVAQAYLRESVILPTHFLGWLLFQRERRLAPHLDLFALLRSTSGHRHDLTELCDDAERVRRLLCRLEGRGELKLYPSVRNQPIDEVVSDAVRTFGMYHLKSAVEPSDTALVVGDPKMLYFYGNRLAPWSNALEEGMA